MKIVWVTRSFLDYRIPVYKELKALNKGQFKLIFNEDYVPNRVVEKAKAELGDSCIGLKGELTIGNKDTTNKWANKGLRIPIQKGLIKRIKMEKPDIIISDGFFQWTYAALWLRFFYKTPHVMCYERTHHTERNAQWFRVFYRKVAIKWIDMICCTGKLCSDYVQSLGFDLKKVTYGHMVADIDTFNIDKSNVKKDYFIDKVDDLNTLIYIYVGRLVDAKGINELLFCWNNFQKRKKVKLFLIGDGPDREKYELKIEEMELKNVVFLGKIEYEKLSHLYKSADVFVMPTLEDNWSLVVPEAMAAGLPILCSIYNGCYPEYITEKNGWVFDPLDQVDFLSNLEKSYHCNYLKELGVASKEIISNFSPLEASKSILKAINQVKHNNVN
ncbi:glycosyltransferase family 4 protein [Seonamhaeicola sp. MEBiC1930]|uniref:glycosyltransferase family 4 protein n=1 Tax=Seonamhaeicola sp. MEBiC01930 TaxID=2976768 RepID=UPI00324370FF